MGGREGVLDLFSVSIVLAFFCRTVLWNLLLTGVYMGGSALIRSVMWDHVNHSYIAGVRICVHPLVCSSVFTSPLILSDFYSLFFPCFLPVLVYSLFFPCFLPVLVHLGNARCTFTLSIWWGGYSTQVSI